MKKGVKITAGVIDKIFEICTVPNEFKELTLCVSLKPDGNYHACLKEEFENWFFESKEQT